MFKMLPKQNRRKLLLTLLINFAVIVVCGVTVISLLIIFKPDTQPDATTEPPTQTTDSIQAAKLICEYQNGAASGIHDYYWLWQLKLVQDETVIKTWSDIYAEYEQDHALLAVEANLKITAAGLMYCGDPTLLYDYCGWAQYQAQTVHVQLPA